MGAGLRPFLPAALAAAAALAVSACGEEADPCAGENGGSGGAGEGACGDTCTGGACAPVCEDGFADCNGDAADGCEAHLASSKEHCGACGAGCGALPHTGVVECVESACIVYGCDAGFGDCNQDAADGCETDTTITTAHCGGCGLDCTAHLQSAASVSCSGGECQFACDADFFDCDRDPSNGCEADVQNDGLHCGACFQDCMFDGPCAEGRCVPVVVVPDAGRPFDVAVDAGDLYWTDNDLAAGAIRRVSPFSENAAPGEIETFVADLLDPVGVTVDSQFVYWTSWGDDKVRRMRRDKTATMEDLGGPTHADPSGIAVAAGNVYWADIDLGGTSLGIYRAALPAGGATLLQAPPALASDVAVRGTTMFFSFPASGGLVAAETSPNAPAIAALLDVLPVFLTTDETHVYFSDGTKVKRVALDLSKETVEDVATADVQTLGVAVDDFFVYFTARDLMGMSPAPTRIYRVRKPW